MKATLPVNHNYYEEHPIKEEHLQAFFKSKSSRVKRDLFSAVYELTSAKAKVQNIQIAGFRSRVNKFEDEDRLILKLYSKQSDNSVDYIIQTGLYAGIIFHNGYQFNITSRYGTAFLLRMLNFLNNIYIEDDFTPASKLEEVNEFQLIIGYLFLKSLEKATILGLPHEYQQQSQRSSKFRGSIDINEYLKRDIPFKGKLTTKFKEQEVVQCIADVLYCAIGKIESQFGSDINKNLLGIKQLLKQHRSNRFVGIERINAAKTHKVLSNPMFLPFKQVLEYAEIIIRNYDLEASETNNNIATTGYLFDISELFEVYLEKLLRFNLKDWYIDVQTELVLYNEMFYKRRMYPDIILKHKTSGKYIVLDAKFKTMRLTGEDLDREDFYQIHTYMQYYSSNVLFGGLIYPISGHVNAAMSHASSLFGLNKVDDCKFIVDGIALGKNPDMQEIINSERDFIDRLNSFIENCQDVKSN
jgi:5-methylcytosine-specific restriction enzyme subunit McrC